MKILIVEDNDSTRLALMSALKSEGYQVEGAEDGAHALKVLKNGKFDFVLSDVNMPKIGGLELAEQLRGHPPIILYTSSRYAPGLMELAKEFGVEVFMTGATLDTIKDKVMSLFDKSVEHNTQLTNSR